MKSNNVRTCKEMNCDNKHWAKDLCKKHYYRIKRNGTTKPKYDLSGYSKLGGIKDVGKGRRGSLAVNVINDIKFKARKRNKKWDLSHEQAFEFIKSPCHYCGFEPNWPKSRVGIDRIDNKKGYLFKNCVPACFSCNSAKGIKSLKEFEQWVRQIANHCPSTTHTTPECKHPAVYPWGSEGWCQICRAKAFA